MPFCFSSPPFSIFSLYASILLRVWVQFHLGRNCHLFGFNPPSPLPSPPTNAGGGKWCLLGLYYVQSIVSFGESAILIRATTTLWKLQRRRTYYTTVRHTTHTALCHNLSPPHGQYDSIFVSHRSVTASRLASRLGKL